MKVNIHSINVELGKYVFSIEELVDETFREKLDSDVREFCKDRLGIDKVHKTYDLSKFDFNDQRYAEPDQSIEELQNSTMEKTLENHKKSDLTLLITAGDNPQYLTPSPTLDLFHKMKLDENIRDLNVQGMACSALSESVRIAEGHFSSLYGGYVAVSITNNYTPWFLHKMKNIDQKISMSTKENLHYFLYALIFSDGASSAVISEKSHDLNSVEIDVDMMSSKRDVYSKDKYWVKHAPSMDGLTFRMFVDTKYLKETVGDLSGRNILELRRMFPVEAKLVQCYNLHTAGKPIVDHVVRKCEINKDLAKITYDVMYETGNTGAMSSLQLLKESIDRKILENGDYGCVGDYAWGRSDFCFYKRIG